MNTRGAAYTTANEMNFLNSLGLKSLQAYLQAASGRKDWGAMDAEQVLTHCRKRIESIESRLVHR